MLLLISWRNLWRNRKRSLVMVAAITAGLWGGLFAASIMFGMVKQQFESAIEQQISHMQIHHPEYIKDRLVEYAIKDWEALDQSLAGDPDIEAYSMRACVHGMLASAHLTRGIDIIGIDPGTEAATTGLQNNLIKGSYFSEGIRNPVLIGQSLAEKTKLQEGSRLVLTFQDIDNELVSAAFRVAGIFQTANSMFDENHVFVLRSDLDQYVAGQPIIHEVALISTDINRLDDIQKRYSEHFPELSIRTWAEISPELSYLREMAGVMLTIILGIILFALAFGLVNTMLMSVFERIRELGMLMAIGMNKKRVFLMILIETSFLSILGALGGIVLGATTIGIFGNRGIDLATVGGESMRDFGFPSLVYPTIEPGFFLTLIVLVVITALITSLYPALKAIRLLPAEAVRKE